MKILYLITTLIFLSSHTVIDSNKLLLEKQDNNLELISTVSSISVNFAIAQNLVCASVFGRT